MTPPFNLALAALDEKPHAAMLALIHHVRAHQWPVPGVRASVPLVDHFARLWSEQTGKQAVLTMGQRTFELTQVIPPRPVPGRLRMAVEADVAALSQHLLDSGWSVCSLTTDLANPVSNHIYQRIGYRPVCDFNEYRFEP